MSFINRIFVLLSIVSFSFSAPKILSASPLDSLYGAEVKVPIVMYHNISEKQSALNPWVITPAEFESDLCFFEQNGFETITMAELIAYVNGEGKLPAKPILLTFDDGDGSVYKYAFPLLQKYNAKAVLSVIGKFSDLYSEMNRPEVLYPNLTWALLEEMMASGLVEIQNHSYDLHKSNGAKKYGDESVEQYRKRLGEDLSKLQKRTEEELGVVPDTFVYPYGIISKESLDIIKELGFQASFSCYDKENTVTVGDPDCLYRLGRTLRPHGKSSETLFGKFVAEEREK